MLRNVTVYQIGLVSGRENKRAGPLSFACDLKREHAHGVDIAWQAVQHPLVTNAVRIDECHREFRTRRKAPFVAVIRKHRSRPGKFFTGTNNNLVFTRETRTAPGELVRIFIHDHTRSVELHPMMGMRMVRLVLLSRADLAGKQDRQDAREQ